MTNVVAAPLDSEVKARTAECIIAQLRERQSRAAYTVYYIARYPFSSIRNSAFVLPVSFLLLQIITFSMLCFLYMSSYIVLIRLLCIQHLFIQRYNPDLPGILSHFAEAVFIFSFLLFLLLQNLRYKMILNIFSACLYTELHH